MKRYSVRVFLRQPIYLEVESHLDEPDRIFDAVNLLMLDNDYSVSIKDGRSAGRKERPDIVLKKDGTFDLPLSIRAWFGSKQLAIPYGPDLVDYAELVDPDDLKAYLTEMGWTFEPWGDGKDSLVGRYGKIVCQVPISNRGSDYADAVARIPNYLAADHTTEALRMAAWIAWQYHQAMFRHWEMTP